MYILISDMKGFMLMSKMLIYVHYFQKKCFTCKNTYNASSHIALYPSFYCMNYEAIDSALFNWVEYCQVKQHMMYVGNTVKMHRIQVQICPLLWAGRDDLYWSRLWWVSTSPFVQLSSPDVHLDHVLVWHFISKTSGAWFEEYSSEFS